MINLDNLPKTVIKGKKRVGRGPGSGRGAKSGRGTTRHQKARESTPLFFEGGQNRLIKKLPLLRGKSRNNSRQLTPHLVSLENLKIIKKGEEVTVDTLIKYKIINKDVIKKTIKIVGNGKIDQALIIKLPISHKAAALILASGGQIKSL